MRNGCFTLETVWEGRTYLSGPKFGIWTREKCCDRPANRTSFQGFVNPLLYLASSHIPGTFRGEMLRHRGVLLSAAKFDSEAEIRALSGTASEIPADIVEELIHYKRHQAFFEAAVRARSQEFAIGTKSCDTIEGLRGTIGDENTVTYVVDLLQEGQKLVTVQGRFINIGAYDGLVEDPLADSLRKRPKAAALAAEMNPKLCRKHRKNLPHVTLWCDMVKPDTVWTMIESWIPPTSPAWEETNNGGLDVKELPVDVVKIDIDSYDCALLEELMHGSFREGAGGHYLLRLKPSIVVMETNDSIPPPIQMSLRYHRSLSTLNLESDFCDGNLPLAGCSLSYQVSIMAKLGFGLIMYTTGNAIFAKNSLLPYLRMASEGQIEGPLNEIECYGIALIGAQCAGPRQIRRWYHEGLPAWQVLEEITDHLKVIERDFDLPALPILLTL